jgi:hypothetical protein
LPSEPRASPEPYWTWNFVFESWNDDDADGLKAGEHWFWMLQAPPAALLPTIQRSELPEVRRETLRLAVLMQTRLTGVQDDVV